MSNLDGNNMEFKEFKVKDLFIVEGTKSLDRNKITFIKEGINFVGRTSVDNGVQGKIEKQSFDPNLPNTITATVIGNYKYVKYQTEPYYCSQNINKLTPKNTLQWNKNIALYFIALIQKFVSKYDGQQGGYKKDELENFVIKIPTKKGVIDFKLIEDIVSNLYKGKAEKVLKNLTKNVKELNVNFDLENFNQIIWKDFSLDSLFEKIKVKSLKYKASELPSEPNEIYNLPALTAGIQNQGLNNYVPRKDSTVLKKVISISANGANTGATFFQNDEFTILQDSYAINWKENKDQLNEYHYLFITTCISKILLGNYDWTNKAGWEKVRKEKISLPLNCKGEIDFKIMELIVKKNKYMKVKSIIDFFKLYKIKE